MVMAMRFATLLLLACVACDDATTPFVPGDGAVDAAALDATRVDAADAAPASDAAVDMAIDQAVDAGADAGPPPPTCVDRPSPRTAPAWRVQGCDWITDGDGARVPQAMVVSADALVRNARTPEHTQSEYRQLARLGVDWVWLLLTWDGIAPRDGTINGAYLGRVCEQVGFAYAEGMQVVLAMHQERWGYALGGFGAPPWATPPNLGEVPAGTVDHPALDMAWDRFWNEPGRAEALQTAWNRLLDTCEGAQGVIGIQPLAAPRGAPDAIAEWTAWIRADAEARFGPLLLFVDGDHPATDAPDTIWAPTAWAGRGPSTAVFELDAARATARRHGMPLFVRGVALDAAAMSAVEGLGAGWAGWHDGYGRDPLALRDMDGVIGPAGALVRDRYWPSVVAGELIGFGADAEGFEMRWRADGRNAGLTIVEVGAAPVVATLSGVGADDFTAHDPLTGELSIFVQGDRPEVILRVTGGE